MSLTMANLAHSSHSMQFLVQTPAGRTAAVAWNTKADDFGTSKGRNDGGLSLERYQQFMSCVVDAVARRDNGTGAGAGTTVSDINDSMRASSGDDSNIKRKRLMQSAYLVHQGRVLSDANFSFSSEEPQHFLQLRLRIRGGTDRQNRVGSKFGGGGQSSSQQSERERKDRLKKLALESIDLAKDPYLVRNHLGSFECKLCLTLHRDEANYLAHTQGKKHQQGIARRAHQEKLKEEQEGAAGLPFAQSTKLAPAQHKVRIGRPAYQVFKSRDAKTNQRCLSFELQYPEIEEDFQPRHRFMSAFEQRIETPPDRRYQYLLFAAEPYETVAFKIPNEPIDKGENRFVTHWDTEGKKLTVTLYFEEKEKTDD